MLLFNRRDMSMASHFSPLRYPGGKGKLLSFTTKLIKQNNLMGCTYVEPFAGGANLALNLLVKGYVSNIVLNDFDRSIYALWYSILNHTEDFCKLILNTPITVEEWQTQKKIQTEKESLDLLTLGFSTFYLNRVNRSGIIKGGLIGGYKQDGHYKMDCRFNKTSLIERIQRIKSYASHISISNFDAEDFIKNSVNNDIRNEKMLIFFDPPYYHNGPELYMNSYKHSQHESLAHSIKSIDHYHWIVTYDNRPEIIDFYHEKSMKTYNLTYSAAKKCLGSEVMFFSNSLTIPDIPIYK
jgi:DNA adenine methylase